MEFGKQDNHGTQSRSMLILKLKRPYGAFIVDKVKGSVGLSAQEIEVLRETHIDTGNPIHGIFNAEYGRVLILDVERFLIPPLSRA
ncbi:chemotaxis protein CheW [Noviherbaspirillum aerium]|uniref:chemotaxis protein CheW n=1 Tax=Noviherbaspirillum aerium TaxID=2588497 RepID=UPI001CEF9AE2